MFNLMSNCCTWFSKIQEPIRKVTILVVGLDKAGKTSSIKGMLRVHQGTDAPPVPTTVCVRNQVRVENFVVTLVDIGGSVESRGAWRELYTEVHGIIFVVDSSDRQRMKEVREVLTDMLNQPRVAGKPILVLANKQDKMNALLASELIEVLSLEKLVNESRSLCHIEACSALMDLRRWSDRKTLRGLRWLLRAVYQDYPELCTRVIQDSKTPVDPIDRVLRRRIRNQQVPSSKSELRQVHRPKDQEKKNTAEKKLQPIRNILQKESVIKRKLKKKKKTDKSVKAKEGGECQTKEEEEDSNVDEEQENSGHREKASSALIPPPNGELKVSEETLDKNETMLKGERRRKKKKVVKVKRKNKINTEEMCGAYSQPVDLSATFDLYRKAIMALKERQDQRQRE